MLKVEVQGVEPGKTKHLRSNLYQLTISYNYEVLTRICQLTQQNNLNFVLMELSCAIPMGGTEAQLPEECIALVEKLGWLVELITDPVLLTPGEI